MLFDPPTPFSMRTYQTPGDMQNPKHKKYKPPGGEKRPPREKVVKQKPNPYRQRIASPEETEFRHANWQRQRDTIRQLLFDAGTSRTAMDRWDNCGAECTVEWSEESQRYRLRAAYCKNRHCRPCAAAKAGLLAKNLRDRLAEGTTNEGDRFRFITLTLRHSDLPLKDQIKKLQTCFTKLRSTKLWKESQAGGVCMIEVKLTAKLEWHPHMHIIADGSWLRQTNLSDEWLRLTGDSFKVDIRAVRTEKDAIAYVTKYVTKGVNDLVWNHKNLAQEWIIACRGLRTAATYGSWRGFRLLKPHIEHQAKDWKPVGLLSRIYQAAHEGSLYEQTLLLALYDALQYDPHKKRRTKPHPPADI